MAVQTCEGQGLAGANRGGSNGTSIIQRSLKLREFIDNGHCKVYTQSPKHDVHPLYILPPSPIFVL